MDFCKYLDCSDVSSTSNSMSQVVVASSDLRIILRSNPEYEVAFNSSLTFSNSTIVQKVVAVHEREIVQEESIRKTTI